MLTVLVPKYRPIVDGPRLWIPELRLQVVGGSVLVDDFDVDSFVASNPGLWPMKPGVPLPDVQVFLPNTPAQIAGNATGATTAAFGTAQTVWMKPVGSRWIEVVIIGGGAGGGSGALQASNAACSGGGGGGAGAMLDARFHPDDLPSEVWVYVAPGGPGAAAQSTNGTAGVNGGGSGRCNFGSRVALTGTALVSGLPGVGTGGQLAAAAGGGAGGTGLRSGSPGGGGVNGAAGSAGGNLAAGPTAYAPCGGGAGGGLSAANATFGGGTGGGLSGLNGNVALGLNAGGAAGGSRGGNGPSLAQMVNYTGLDTPQGAQRAGLPRSPTPGYGGGGGGAANGATNGGAGGNGGQYGAGGGGGGAATNGAISGAGGCGGDGILVVVAW